MSALTIPAWAAWSRNSNPQLHGVPGRMFTAMDARRRVLGSSEREPEPGRNLVLTIDSNIQFLAERALDHAMERTQADNGTVVVQDVHTGQILALAIRPTFNPNQFRHTTPALLRDHAVSDVYEPGSTFKLVTYSAALDQGVTKPDDMIDCQGGQIILNGRVIHDDKSDHYQRHHRARSAGAFQRRSRRETGPQDRPRQLLQVHSRISASAAGRASNCPAKRAACCGP